MIAALVGVTVTAGVVVLLLGTFKPSLAPVARFAGMLLPVFLALGTLSGILLWLKGAFAALGGADDLFERLSRLVGIGLVSSLLSAGARDAGQTALAEGVEFAGRVLLTSMSLPVVWGLVETVRGMLP